MQNKLNDAVYGYAIGDAIGVPIEFLNRSNFKNKKVDKMLGYGSHKVPEGTWSDDTSMLLATIDSIAEKGKIDYSDMMDKFCNWFYKNNYTSTDKVFDIGNTTYRAIYNYSVNMLPAKECGEKDERSNGNGSLMRILPIALYLNDKNMSEEEETNLVNDISSLTHAHDVSKLGCKIYVDYIKLLLDGNDKYDAYQKIKDMQYWQHYSMDAVEKYDRILKGDISIVSEDDIKSTGYVVYSLEAALWSILNNDNYKESIVTAINLGGDTDTIGAITGGIAGILYGKEAIPKDWIDSLKNKECIDSICSKFNENRHQSQNVIYK